MNLFQKILHRQKKYFAILKLFRLLRNLIRYWKMREWNSYRLLERWISIAHSEIIQIKDSENCQCNFFSRKQNFIAQFFNLSPFSSTHPPIYHTRPHFIHLYSSPIQYLCRMKAKNHYFCAWPSDSKMKTIFYFVWVCRRPHFYIIFSTIHLSCNCIVSFFFAYHPHQHNCPQVEQTSRINYT